MLNRNLTNLVLIGIFLPILGSLISVVFFDSWRFDHKAVHTIFEVTGSLIAIFLSVFLLSNTKIKKEFSNN